jgi:hypothetical protein
MQAGAVPRPAGNLDSTDATTLPCQSDTTMTKKPAGSAQMPPPDSYVLTEEAYTSLCSVRDELRLFAAVATRQAQLSPEVVIRRNMLAHCFDHLAQRMERVMDVLPKHVTKRRRRKPREPLLRDAED